MTLMQIIKAASMAEFASQTPTLRLEMFRLLELSMEHHPVPFTLLRRYLDFWVAANPTRDPRVDINLNRTIAQARETVDMYPLLMRCRGNPRSRLRVRANQITYDGAQGVLVDPAANAAMRNDARRVIRFQEFFDMLVRRPARDDPYDRTKWFNFLGNAVKQLDIQSQVNNDCFEMLLKRRDTPDWLASGSGGTYRGARWKLDREIDQWEVNTGLESFPRVVSPRSSTGEI